MSATDEQLEPDPVVTEPHGTAESGTYSFQAIRKLNALTSNFYARETASFSATRQAPWRGWDKAWELISKNDPAFAHHAAGAADAVGASLAVLDLGCGNLRFERFLAERTSAPVRVLAFDNCPDLAAPAAGPPERVAVEFQTLDIVEALLDGTFADRLPRAECDLAVAFGLMHHLPTSEMRARLLEGLLASLKPGGFAVLSFWQFLHDPRLAAKAAATTAEGRAAHHLPAFQENDFLLGWQHAEDIYRFCHHTTETEIDALLAALLEPEAAAAGKRTSRGSCVPAVPLPFREIGRFSADGKTGNLNRYLVLQRL